MNDSKKFSMPDLDSPQTRKAIIAVTVLVCAALLFFKVKPAYDQTQAQRVETDQVNGEVAKLNNDYTALIKNQNRSLAKSLVVALPRNVSLDTEYKRLTLLGGRVGAKITSMEQSGEPQPQGEYQKVSVTLSVQCRYQACLRFLGGMQGMVRPRGQRGLDAFGPIWSVDQLQLSPGEPASLSMNASVYLAGDEQQAASATAPAAAPSTPATTP